MDVKYCNQTGISIAFWVAFREANIMQGLIEFGSGDCGLTLVRTSDNEINVTIRSMELGNTWSVQSVNASIDDGMWHHVALTWNATGEVHIFINGTRCENNYVTFITVVGNRLAGVIVLCSFLTLFSQSLSPPKIIYNKYRRIARAP